MTLSFESCTLLRVLTRMNSSIHSCRAMLYEGYSTQENDFSFIEIHAATSLTFAGSMPAKFSKSLHSPGEVLIVK